MMGVDSHGKWGVPKQALKWEVAPDQPVCWETQILNLTKSDLPLAQDSYFRASLSHVR